MITLETADRAKESCRIDMWGWISNRVFYVYKLRDIRIVWITK